MDADHFFKSAAWLLVGICFTLVVISIMDRKSNLRAFNEAHVQPTGNATALVPSASDTPALLGNQSASVTAHCSPVSYMPTLRTAVDLGRILGQLDMKTGAELGAKDGNFTKLTLSHWKTAELYVLVDEWPVLHGVNHTHFHDNHAKEKALAAVQEMVSAQKLKEYQICHNKTTVCAGRFADDSFDFVYLNAHHDDKSLLVDMRLWWPKLRPQGIMAGHYNHPTGAVDDFFSDQLGDMHGCPRQTTVSYKDTKIHIWATRK